MGRITFEGNFCDISMCRENPCPYNGMCSQRETWERLKKYEDAEQDGRLVLLPEVSEKDRKLFADGLHDYFLEAKLYDPSVGIFGMTDGETALADALMEVLEERTMRADG